MTFEQPSPIGGAAALGADWGAALALHEEWLRKVILARTGEAQAVDEVFQRVALAAIEQAAPLADSSKVAPWLHRLAVVQSSRYRRKLGRERRALRGLIHERTILGNGHAKDILAWLVAKERHEQTREALARIAGADAEVLLLKYGQRWSCRQIAERLGISEKAVESRLTRARLRLRHELLALGIQGDE
ncbi:MAG TPA: sigma-70 family RNA polymerase sigma factor [Planctomycetaceae bacterium]|nr:sigma-70 family RNA polymerase sigma factor [Planctomycetaceae bacterium]